MHVTAPDPICVRKGNVLASGVHDGGPAFIYHPSGSIDILKPPGLASRAARGFVPACGDGEPNFEPRDMRNVIAHLRATQRT